MLVRDMEQSSFQKEKSTSSDDCLSCRLISFTGLTGSSVYVAYQIKRQQGLLGKSVLAAFATGLAYIGVARLVNIYPFGTTAKGRGETRD